MTAALPQLPNPWDTSHMPRVGQNPMKQVRHQVAHHDVTVCTIVYIPSLDGYWEHSLDVLRVCIGSLIHNTEHPFDLFVLDNGSCPEVISYLTSLSRDGHIKSLLLCNPNMGKLGAFNMLFPACPGRYIAYTDSDVLFRPGWLKRSLELFDVFDRVGMVTGRPYRHPKIVRDELMGSTFAAAEASDEVEIQRASLIAPDVLAEHATSIGARQDETLTDPNYEDVCLTRGGVSAFAYAGHFQFVTPKEVAAQILPLPVTRAVGGDKAWDLEVNRLGLMRLSVTEPLVRHLGNTLSTEEFHSPEVSTFIGDGAFSPAAPAARNTGHTGPLRRTLTRLAGRRIARKAMEKAYYALFESLYRS